jgi:hypothetical protein
VSSELRDCNSEGHVRADIRFVPDIGVRVDPLTLQSPPFGIPCVGSLNGDRGSSTAAIREFRIPIATLRKLSSGMNITMTVRGSEELPHEQSSFRFGITPRTSRSIAIDGMLSEYEGAPSMRLDDKSQRVGYIGTASDYDPASHSAEAKALWTEHGLHIAARIRDDVPMLNPNSSGPDIYKGDEIEVYVGPKGYRGEHYAKPEHGFYHFALSPGIGGKNAVVSDFAAEVSGSRIAAVVRPYGYDLEAFIPRASLGNMIPEPGSVIAWDLQLNDRDDYSVDAPVASLTWNGDGMNWLKATRWGMAIVR